MDGNPRTVTAEQIDWAPDSEHLLFDVSHNPWPAPIGGGA